MTAGLVQESLPVPGDPAGGSRHRLFGGVMPGRGQVRPFEELLCRVVPEPILVGLEALRDAVPGVGGVVACVLRR